MTIKEALIEAEVRRRVEAEFANITNPPVPLLLITIPIRYREEPSFQLTERLKHFNAKGWAVVVVDGFGVSVNTVVPNNAAKHQSLRSVRKAIQKMLDAYTTTI